MDNVAVHQRNLEYWHVDSDAVLPCCPDMFEHKAESLEQTVLDVQLEGTVLVHKDGEDCQGHVGLCNDGHENRGTHPHLAVLDLEVVEERT